MGYTHYLDQSTDIRNLAQWRKFAKLVQNILDYNKDIITGWDGEPDTEIIVNDNEISFNGITADAHETCSIKRSPADEFEFCKTAYKPYDKVVVAIYKLYEMMFKDVTFSSDGEDSDHEEGEDLLNSFIAQRYRR